MQKRKRVVDLSQAPSKKRKKTSAVEEITYDARAREDYLTGFHKRKLQRAKHAREEAVKKEKAERVEARRNLRKARKEDLEKHVAEVNAIIKAQNREVGSGSDEDEEDEEDEGDAEAAAAVNGGQAEQPLDTEDEYVDEDKHTTVTIEAVSVTRDGLEKVVGDDDGSGGDDDVAKGQDGEEQRNTKGRGNSESRSKRVWTKERPGGPKKKKKAFRYESKAERKVTRLKERSSNKRQAKERKG